MTHIPNSPQFLSYGNPLFTGLLESVPKPDTMIGAVARYADVDGLPVIGWYDLSNLTHSPIATLGDLKKALVHSMPVVSSDTAEGVFQDEVANERRVYQERSANS